jgi:hypothetical protein
MAKNPHAVALGARGGRVGGKSTSPRKRAAARKNAAKATAARLQKRGAR